jgi:hypothetical protein
MNDTPWTRYAEQQLASTGFAVLDIDIAKRLRPSLFDKRGSSGAIRDDGNTAALERLIAEARANGTLYDATIRVTEKTRVVTPGSCAPRWLKPGDERIVPVVALSPTKLRERLGWLGLDAVTVAPAGEVSEPAELTPEELAQREAHRAEVRTKLGLYDGHPPPPSVA